MAETEPKWPFRAVPPRRRARGTGRFRQWSLFCRCGTALPAVCGLCRSCYWRRRNSRRRFGGRREGVLERDGAACRVCGVAEHVVVHHRRPGDHRPAWLVALCAACHARVHRVGAMRKWLPDALVPLWAEQHPGVAVQLQLELAEAPVG